MPNINIIAVGRLKAGPVKELFEEYHKRMKWGLSVQEIDIRDKKNEQQQIENKTILSLLPPKAVLFVLDERGKALSSTDFSESLDRHFSQGKNDLYFVIGGADGLSDEVRARATHLISFGAMTWPHMMVRVMLAEQIYRAQQILSGHPYHRGD